MNFRQQPQRQKGSLVLVALCFVAVLGIVLAGYMSVSNQALKLSNRSYQTSVSRQLAESGLEGTLLTFNKNLWDPTLWTITGNTATRTITFPSTKYGNGVVGSINLRVDNYNAYNATSVWNATSNYDVSDLVGRNGIWYRCLQAHSNQAPPNIMYWAEAPIPWKWNTSAYSIGDLANYNGNWYRCTVANTNLIPSANPAKWEWIPLISFTWNVGTMYDVHSLVYYGGSSIWYESTGAFLSLVPPPLSLSPFPLPVGLGWQSADISWNWRATSVYAFDDVVYYGGTWYRSKISPNTGNLPTNTAYWDNALNLWPWSSSETYQLNDVVYYGGSWYRCILAHTNQTPPNTTYWSSAPLLSNSWTALKTYAVDDVVYSGGIWYRCLLGNKNNAPPNINYWTSASAATAASWSSATSYNINDYASYGGVWYRCLAAHSNRTPNNATYWSAIKAPIIYVEGVATLPGVNAAPVKVQLRATVAAAPLFPNAVAASSTVTLGSSASAGLVDSYNSDQGPYNSTTTPFTTAAPNVSYSAVLAGGSSSGTAVTLTGGTLQGYIAAPPSASSPFAPLYATGSGANVTGSATATGVDSTRITRSPYIPQFDVLPVASRTQLSMPSPWPSGGISIGTPGATTPTVYYVNESGNGMDLNATNEIITINGPVVLDVQGQLRVRQGGKIILTTTGSAEIHFTTRLRVDNLGAIDNRTRDPKKLILIGTSPSSTSYFRSPTAFYGTIYMPNTTLPVDDNGDGVSIYGAVSADTLPFASPPALHYDTTLRSATFGGIDTPYLINEWRELTDASERVAF